MCCQNLIFIVLLKFELLSFVTSGVFELHFVLLSYSKFWFCHNLSVPTIYFFTIIFFLVFLAILCLSSLTILVFDTLSQFFSSHKLIFFSSRDSSYF